MNRLRLLAISVICILMCTGTLYAKKHILFVGTYTEGYTNGIFVYSFNDRSGKLKNLNLPIKISNPSFLTISKDKKYLYAVGELGDSEEEYNGGVSAFKIERKGRLSFINHVHTRGSNPCHVSVSPDGKKVCTSNYSGGNLSFFNVLPDGKLSEIVQKVQHTGSGPNINRQSSPHVHSSQFDNAGKVLYAADLGTDEIKVYSVSRDEGYISTYSTPTIKMAPGAGPRHFVFSNDERYLYVVNELNSTVSVMQKYGGDWKNLQNLSTLPKDFEGKSFCADIHLSTDGKFLYASNRGHNSIAVFRRDIVSGRLDMVGTFSVEGDWPRNFTIDPSGKFILVANQRSNDITVFKIDPESGKGIYTEIKVSNQSPVCLQFL